MTLRMEPVFVQKGTLDPIVRSDVRRFNHQSYSAPSTAPARVEASVTRTLMCVPVHQDGWVQCAPSHAHQGTMVLAASMNATVTTMANVIQKVASANVLWATQEIAVGKSVPSESMVRTVKKPVTV